MAKENKKIKFNVFNKWEFKDIFGYKIIKEEGIDYVNFVWCKICAKHCDKTTKTIRSERSNPSLCR